MPGVAAPRCAVALECTLAAEPSGDGGLSDFERGKSLGPLLPAGSAAAGVAKDAATAAAAYCAAAGSGHIQATTHLAILFHAGQLEGAKEGLHLQEAERLYTLAAKAGCAHAMCNLATLPTYVSFRTAEQQLSLTKQAAELGHLRAMTNLGSMYETGLQFALAKDPAAALEWWRKAAAADFVMGQFNVGIALRDGIGTSVDHAESVVWLSKAAEQGYGLARYNLAVALCEGKGVAADYARASELYRAEATAGFGPSRRALVSEAPAHSAIGQCLVTPSRLLRGLQYRSLREQSEA